MASALDSIGWLRLCLRPLRRTDHSCSPLNLAGLMQKGRTAPPSAHSPHTLASSSPFPRLTSPTAPVSPYPRSAPITWIRTRASDTCGSVPLDLYLGTSILIHAVPVCAFLSAEDGLFHPTRDSMKPLLRGSKGEAYWSRPHGRCGRASRNTTSSSGGCVFSRHSLLYFTKRPPNSSFAPATRQATGRFRDREAPQATGRLAFDDANRLLAQPPQCIEAAQALFFLLQPQSWLDLRVIEARRRMRLPRMFAAMHVRRGDKVKEGVRHTLKRHTKGISYLPFLFGLFKDGIRIL